MEKNKEKKFNKMKVLCVCTFGWNKGRHLADYLWKKGYFTRWRGLNPCEFKLKFNNCLIEDKDIEWADVILLSREKYRSILRGRFGLTDEKIVCLDVVLSRTCEETSLGFGNIDQCRSTQMSARFQLMRDLKDYLLFIKKFPVKINLKVDREVNFLMILYQIIKNQNSFENLCFEGLDKLNSKDKEKIKDVLRGGNSFIDGIYRDEKLKDIYLVNKEVFERYWNNNRGLLGKIKNILEEKCNSYDFSIFEKVERFFDFEGPREVDIYLCLGNETMAGTGNAFSPNLAFLFPRDFKNYSKKTVDADFAVLIHEVMHLFQNMCNEPDRVLREKVAQCFAPRGILINEDKYSGDKDFFEKIKSSFCKGEAYSDIRKRLSDGGSSLIETKIELKGGARRNERV